jgi:DNA-binding NarL/FixJ family response regulator
MVSRRGRAFRSRPLAKTERARILIVDEHEMLRRGLRTMLEEQGDLRVCGESADEATALRQYQGSWPDLVILGVNLDTGRGLNLIKRLKAIDPRARVLVYSLGSEQADRERARRAGAMGCLSKQEPAPAMLRAIRDVLHDKPHFSQDPVHRPSGRKAADTLTPKLSSLMSRLSERELMIFELMGHGLPVQGIADRLQLSARTVDTYRERLKVRLELDSTAELRRHAIEWVLARS